MSTVLIVIIAIVALLVLALLVSAASRRRRTRQLGEAQVQAKHDDVSHHREQANEARVEAELAEERSKRAAAEADLNERKAREGEQALEGED